jgi:hypothetical protein
VLSFYLWVQLLVLVYFFGSQNIMRRVRILVQRHKRALLPLYIQIRAIRHVHVTLTFESQCYPLPKTHNASPSFIGGGVALLIAGLSACIGSIYYAISIKQSCKL